MELALEESSVTSGEKRGKQIRSMPRKGQTLSEASLTLHRTWYCHLVFRPLGKKRVGSP